MRMIFTPKHQRLVNQCYPTGRTTDKKPKSSETSYLLYYVNSRRSKLEKVSSYLKKRTSSDLGSRRRAGNVSVTLELMDKIVKNCKENLNVFIKDFFTIMNNVMSSGSVNNDVAIVELVDQVFYSICSNIDGTLYNSDTDFNHYFSSFVDQFLKVIKTILKNDDLLLNWCVDISQISQLSSNPKLNHYISEAVNLSLVKFQERHSRYSKPNILDDTYNDNEQLLSKRLTRTQTRMIGLDNVKGTEFDSDTSIKALQQFFNTTETEKLNISLRVLLTRLQETPNKEFLEFICNGVQVQLRYIVIILIMRQLTIEEKKVDPVICLRLMSSLLTSDVSIVGLSILDIIRKIIEYQLKHLSNKRIVDQCRFTLRDVEFKTYYKGQTTDVLYDIVGRINSITHDSALDNEQSGLSTQQLKKSILIDDLLEVTSFKKDKCMSIELYVELIPYFNKNLLGLFELIDNQIPGAYIFNRLFQTIETQGDIELEKELMEAIFNKYKKYALFAGLKYFYEETTEIPSYIYYCYHSNAAKFIGLHDYATQADYKYENKTLFSKEDLLNFYSDEGSNPYSQRGTQILLSKSAMGSVTDLTADHQVKQSMIDTPEKSLVALTSSQAEKLEVLKQRTDKSRNGTIGTNNGLYQNRNNIYRHVSDDTRSLKSLGRKTPNIKQLKKAVKNAPQNEKNMFNQTVTLPLRGSQSVKSRVTNITFLLNELKSIDTGSEMNRIRDPDEEDIVGLGKIDMARSQSSRLSRHGSTTSNENRRSFMMKRMLNNSNKGIAETLESSETDDFQDAHEEVNIMDTRGMLFNTA
ncbi:similar to Saccharomyces cerevisiae YMR212C EFR3 Protein required for Stt4-containing phosphoinositide kinase patch assembly at the plasma membrane [Maudiozyma saulgeensis]|uniref:Protein EFR3 n=1 Tax=Maudiozyma saulgeensis TaxID=1789683 RepID=A0A1X7R8T7_9SACH|nr:similar to Saccharomyces cerevisiae YMR212C EFR3 Protein required for Stt4-containing phosphoinositide kinase patch assembly at the plasma membrane [Kazachstania saulgeensis]